jgi:hypothetical protein
MILTAIVNYRYVVTIREKKIIRQKKIGSRTQYISRGIFKIYMICLKHFLLEQWPIQRSWNTSQTCPIRNPVKSDRNSRSQSISLTLLFKKKTYFKTCHHIQCLLIVAFNTIGKPFEHNEYDWKMSSYDHEVLCKSVSNIRYIRFIGR